MKCCVSDETGQFLRRRGLNYSKQVCVYFFVFWSGSIWLINICLIAVQKSALSILLIFFFFLIGDLQTSFTKCRKFCRKFKNKLTRPAIAGFTGNKDVAFASSVSVGAVHRRRTPDPSIGLHQYDDGEFVFVRQGQHHSENSCSPLIG